MNLDRWLAIAGLVLGLPGFLILIFSASIVIGTVMLVLGAFAGAGWFALHHVTQLPPFTVKKNVTSLEFPIDRNRAVLKKEYVFRANHKDQRYVSFRNNSCDGAFQQFTWNGGAIPAASIIREAGDTRIEIRLAAAPGFFKEFSGTLGIEVVNAFNSDTEFLIFAPDFPTRHATVRISLPPGDVCKGSSACMLSGSSETPFEAPVVSEGGRLISLEIKKPRMGSEYKVMWSW